MGLDSYYAKERTYKKRLHRDSVDPPIRVDP